MPFIKGHIPYNKGKKGNSSWNKGMKGYVNAGSFKKGHPAINIREGENHPYWTDDMVGYNALHHWVRRTLGGATKCENGCLNAKRYDWANISYEYKREVSDWMQLCRSCHKKRDRANKGHNAKEFFREAGRAYL